MARKERFSIGLNAETKSKIDRMAKLSNRSIGNICETLIELALKGEGGFIDVLLTEKKQPKEQPKEEPKTKSIEGKFEEPDTWEDV